MIRVELRRVLIRGEEVVKDVSFEVPNSEVHLIAGPSGSGKSLILKLVAGLVHTLYGGVEVDGEVLINDLSPKEALVKGLVTYVPQDLSTTLVTKSLVSELRALGIKPDYGVIKSLGIEDVISRDFSELSAGMKYRVLTALVTHLRPAALLLDEPSTYVDPPTLKPLLKLLRYLSSEYGTSVLIADHRVSLISKYCDEVHYLGGTTECCSCELLNTSSSSYLELRDVWFRYSRGSEWVIKGLSTPYLRNSLVCVVGGNGSGKTTLARLIVKYLRPIKGLVKVPKKVFYVPQEPIYWFIDDDVLSTVKSLSVKDPRELIKSLGLNPKKAPHALSVGEARRLGIYVALTSGADLVVIDEPTIGLDEESRVCVKELIGSSLESGKSVVITTHDREFIRGLRPDLVIDLGGLGG